jgi:tryptophan synthase alpha chain
MTSLNPVVNYGIKKFMQSGIDGFIIPDLIPEESDEILSAAKKYNVKSVFIITPDTDKKRIKKIASLTTGFIYFITYSGVTGSTAELKTDVLKKIIEIKKMISLPVYIGFGIKSANDLKKVFEYADGGIIGSAIINGEITASEILKVKQKNAV